MHNQSKKYPQQNKQTKNPPKQNQTAKENTFLEEMLLQSICVMSNENARWQVKKELIKYIKVKQFFTFKKLFWHLGNKIIFSAAFL